MQKMKKKKKKQTLRKCIQFKENDNINVTVENRSCLSFTQSMQYTQIAIRCWELTTTTTNIHLDKVFFKGIYIYIIHVVDHVAMR